MSEVQGFCGATFSTLKMRLPCVSIVIGLVTYVRESSEASIEGAQTRWVFGPETNELSRTASSLRELFLGEATAVSAGVDAGPSALSNRDLSRVQLPPSIPVARSQAEIVIPAGDRGDRTIRLTDIEGQLYVGTDEEPPSLELVGRLEPGQGRFEIDASLDDGGLPSARAR